MSKENHRWGPVSARENIYTMRPTPSPSPSEDRLFFIPTLLRVMTANDRNLARPLSCKNALFEQGFKNDDHL